MAIVGEHPISHPPLSWGDRGMSAPGTEGRGRDVTAVPHEPLGDPAALVTDDMLAAVPEMLRLLKMVQMLMDSGIELGLDGCYLRYVIGKAEGRD